MNKLIYLGIIALFLTSCGGDDDSNPMPLPTTLTLNLTGLEELGQNYVYEGWLLIGDTPVSTGTFSSVTFPQSFEVSPDDLASANAFVLSIEPTVDPDPAPSSTKVLSGSFNGTSAEVSSKNLVGDFDDSTGAFILATPTDGMDNNEDSGVWFIDNSSGDNLEGLHLPTLPAGWQYEGWVVMDGMPVSTGTFTSFNAPDHNATTSPYKGTLGDGPDFPGEDYVMGSVGDINFPTDLRGTTVVVSVEPNPDNSPAPFTLKPLASPVPANAAVHTTINMGHGPVLAISGTASR